MKKCFLDKYDKIVELLLLIIFLTMLFSTFIQVVTRYIFTPLPWTEEIARYSYVWIIYLGSALVYKRKKHIKLNLLTSFFTKKMNMINDLIIRIISTYFFIIIAVNGYRYSITMGRVRSSAINMPLKYLYIILPIGFTLMAIVSILYIFEDYINMKSGNMNNRHQRY